VQTSFLADDIPESAGMLPDIITLERLPHRGRHPGGGQGARVEGGGAGTTGVDALGLERLVGGQGQHHAGPSRTQGGGRGTRTSVMDEDSTARKEPIVRSAWQEQHGYPQFISQVEQKARQNQQRRLPL